MSASVRALRLEQGNTFCNVHNIYKHIKIQTKSQGMENMYSGSLNFALWDYNTEFKYDNYASPSGC